MLQLRDTSCAIVRNLQQSQASVIKLIFNTFSTKSLNEAF